MPKNREAVTCNGRAAFFAAMWDDIRQCAMDNGWAVALHGSLASDMDIMAMPWVDNCCKFSELAEKISQLFEDNDLSKNYAITYNEKPHNRVVATIPIWADFYLDICAIEYECPESQRLIFTGCYDKRGERISVGSICEMQILGEIPRLYKIVQEHGAYGLLPVHPEKVHEDDRKFRMLYREDDDPWSVYLTVVGNIYDNPELLE